MVLEVRVPGMEVMDDLGAVLRGMRPSVMMVKIGEWSM